MRYNWIQQELLDIKELCDDEDLAMSFELVVVERGNMDYFVDRVDFNRVEMIAAKEYKLTADETRVGPFRETFLDRSFLAGIPTDHKLLSFVFLVHMITGHGLCFAIKVFDVKEAVQWLAIGIIAKKTSDVRTSRDSKYLRLCPDNIRVCFQAKCLP